MKSALLSNSVKACALLGMTMIGSDVLATAIYSSDVSAELTYSITSGDSANLDTYGETVLFFDEANFSGNATSSASGSNDASSFTFPLLASAAGSASAVGAANSEWSVDAFLDFENLGNDSIEIEFTLNWSYNESSSIDNLLYEGAEAFSFILLTEISDAGDITDLFDVDTLYTPSLAGSDSGTLSFSRWINGGELYSLELLMTAEGSAYSEERPTNEVPAPNPFALSFIGLLGMGFFKRFIKIDKGY